jgi:hypothetical protein
VAALLADLTAEMLRLTRDGLDDAIRRSGIRIAGRCTTTQLTNAVGGLSGTRRRFPYATARSALVDVVVHSFDIGVALNRPIAPPPQVTAVWKHLPGLWPRPPVTLKATDVPWQKGEGPVVEAPIADILLTLTGRATL